MLSLGDQNDFMADELKRLNGELKSLDRSIEQIDSQPVDTEPLCNPSEWRRALRLATGLGKLRR